VVVDADTSVTARFELEPPPGTEPLPGTEPPGTEPPGTEPPGTEPPGTGPPSPGPPSGLRLVSVDYPGLASMRFVDNSDNESGFRVYVNGVRFSDLGQNVTSFTIDAECDPKSVYVTAYNDGGESRSTNAVTVVLEPGECVEAPLAPSGLAEVARGGEPEWARFTFVDNSDNEDGFRVYISWGPGEGRQTVLPANRTSFQEILPICEASLVWVTAFNSAGESGQSNTINVVGPCDPPDPPSAMVPNVYRRHYVDALARLADAGFYNVGYAIGEDEPVHEDVLGYGCEPDWEPCAGEIWPVDTEIFVLVGCWHEFPWTCEWP
jgi:hypothetical protein